jgi:hypothetical protein
MCGVDLELPWKTRGVTRSILSQFFLKLELVQAIDRPVRLVRIL